MAILILRPAAQKFHGAACGGMRNRIAHGYFEINLELVWDTVQQALPELLAQLPRVHAAAMEQG